MCYASKVQMPSPGRCMSADKFVLNYVPVIVAPIQKHLTPSFVGEGILSSKHINDLGTNIN
jgi:hypothetical protein